MNRTFSEEGAEFPDMPEGIIAPKGYQLIEKLGAGGMGVVWKAKQTFPDRFVAIKFISAGTTGSDRARARFDREVEIAASLTHDHIVRVFFADHDRARNHFYIVMELIRGEPLDVYATKRKLSLKQRLSLMLLICQAVQHAHEKGVIHRDLKPSNVLVSEDGAPHIVDFGLAKAIGDSDANVTVTQHGAAVGTPAYMAPEQAAGKWMEVDTRCDVYSLGVMLFGILTGKHPHGLEGSRFDVIKRVIETDALKPRQFNREIDADLQAITLKALARDRRCRYTSAGELAKDLESYLEGRPVVARPPTASYLLRKMLYRHRGKVAMALSVLAVMIGIVVIAFNRVRDERDRYQKELARSLVAEGDSLLAADDPRRAKAKYEQSIELSRQLHQASFNAEVALWHAYWMSPPAVVSHDFGKGAIKAMLPLGGGRHVAVAAEGAWWRLDLATGEREEMGRYAGEPRGAVSSDGKIFAYLPEGESGIAVCDALTGRKRRMLPATREQVSRMIFVDDDRQLLAVSELGLLHRWDIASGEPALPVQLLNVRSNIKSIAALPGTRLLGSQGGDGNAIWDWRDGSHESFAHSNIYGPGVVAATSKGSFALAASGMAMDVFHDEQRRARLVEHRTVTCADIVEGNRVLSGDDFGNVILWGISEAGKVTVVHRYSDHQEGTAIIAVAFLDGGRAAISAGADGTVKVWTVDELHASHSTKVPTMKSSQISADGRLIAVVQDEEEPFVIWDLMTGQAVRRFEGPVNSVEAIALCSDNRRVITADVDNNVTVQDVRTAAILHETPIGARVSRLACSPDDSLLALVMDGQVRVLRTDDLSTICSIAQDKVEAIAFSPDGRFLVAGGARVTAVWRVGAGAVAGDAAGTLELPGPAHVSSLAWDVDGERIAVGNTNGGVTVWHWREETSVHILPEALRVTAVAFGTERSSRYLLIGDQDDWVWLWDLQADQAVCKLRHSGGETIQSVRLEEGATKAWIASGQFISHWDFTLPSGCLATAEAPLALRSQEPSSLVPLGRWYIRRGRREWGADLLKQAVSRGIQVSALELAQAYWFRSGDHLAEALSAFQQARQEATTEDGWDYIDSCISNVKANLAEKNLLPHAQD